MARDAQQSLFSDLRKELAGLYGELKEMASLRWQLAQIELRADLRLIRGLAIVWAVAAIMLLIAVPIIIVGLAAVLDGCGGISMVGWLLLFAGGLALIALSGSYVAWRRFRRQFIGLQETLEELREDLLWLRERSL